MVELTWNGKALVVTLLFRLLFGGYVVGMDQYHFNDLESAWTVLVIYALIGPLGELLKEVSSDSIKEMTLEGLVS